MKLGTISTLALFALVACSSGSDFADGTGGNEPAGATKVSPDLYIPPPRLAQWTNLTTQTGTCADSESLCRGSALVPSQGSPEAPGSWEVSAVTDDYLLQAEGAAAYVFPNDNCEQGTIGAGPNHPPCIRNVTSLAADVVGNAYWIDSSTGHIHYLFAGWSSDIDLDEATGNPANRWISVAVGAPVATASNSAPSSQIWAISPSGDIYAFMGYIQSGGYATSADWFRVGGSAVQIGFMNETNPTSLCGSSWHVPWVRTSAGQIFQFVPGENNCYTGWWSQLPGAATQLTSGDIVLGTNGAIYTWSAVENSFLETKQPSLPVGASIVSVGGQPGLAGIIMATDTNHTLWKETCGTYGC